AEAAVVVVAVAAGRAARLQHGYAQTVLPDQTQGDLGTSDEGGRDIGAAVGQHRQTAVEHRATLAAGNFRWRPWRRQAAGHLGTQRHDATLGLPLQQQCERAVGAAVVTYLVAEQTTADQQLFHAAGLSAA